MLLDELLTPEQVAGRFPALTIRYLQMLRSKGMGPPYSKPSGGKVVYTVADIQAWLDAARVNSTSERR